MAEVNFEVCCQEALTKAFACDNLKTRLAYLQLAEFYEEQAQKQALRRYRAPLQIFR